MWFYVPALVVIVLFVWWVSRTNLFRHFRSGHNQDPSPQGSHRGDGGAYWPGGGGDVGGGGYDGGGGFG